ncbi:MAG TPA: nuclear transport factor 2 family protein [Flavobacterium sp.]|nr:nuclear transport factor 2 family protein [Flavobacterium sp.]
MKNTALLFVLLISVFGNAQTSEKAAIAKTLDDWHKAAADAKFETYFSLMASDAVFIGTDPTENWQLQEFKDYSKPYFDKGKAWSFKSVQRNIYLNKEGNFAWFDELLDTQMKICRGSGILRKENGHWKIAQYVLSMTVPNDNTDEVVKLKGKFDDQFLENLKENAKK